MFFYLFIYLQKIINQYMIIKSNWNVGVLPHTDNIRYVYQQILNRFLDQVNIDWTLSCNR